MTNERAYNVQVAMLNGMSDFDQIAWVTHRPKGLHRLMNLYLVTGHFCSDYVRVVVFFHFFMFKGFRILERRRSLISILHFKPEFKNVFHNFR